MQFLHRPTTESGQQATDQNAKPDLNLIEPRTVLGGRHETDAMARIGEKSGTGAHTGEMAAFAFDAQLLLDVTLPRHQTDQGFGLMNALADR